MPGRLTAAALATACVVAFGPAWADAPVAAAALPAAAAVVSPLVARDLLDGSQNGPWPMHAFAPSGAARPASHVFEGRLVLGQPLAGGGFRVLRDRDGDATANAGAAARLPAFDFAFVQDAGALIPVVRGAVQGEHLLWEFIVEPGRVWDEPGERGLSRAALPFTLEERNQNCMHNGVLTFLFGDGDRVSNVAFEIAQETCQYFQFDMWGLAAARYLPGAVPGRAGIVAARARELEARLPTRPLARLAADHPGIDPAQFGSALDVSPFDLTVYGVVVDGIHYVAGCDTRLGAYPYCDELDLPSYSLAKSLFAGLATMRLEKLYPGAAAARIADYVPECAAHGWSDVTFAQALDMATGHFSSDAYEQDEDAPELMKFFLAEDHATRIRFACSQYPRRLDPGQRWVYHSSDSYLLGAALAAFYRAKHGPGVDLYRDLLVEPIWNRLGLSPALATTRRTRDAARQPFTGYGLTLNRDDIARLGVFLNVAHGAVDGEALIDPGMLRAALQQDPQQSGLPTSDATLRYKNGFWARDAAVLLGCSAPTWIPFMSGYGGITVALLPNGVVYYYFSDGGAFAWARAAQEGDRLRPFCQRAAP